MQRYLTDCTLCAYPADSGIESQSTGDQGAKAGPADPRPLPNGEAMRLDRPLPEFFGAYPFARLPWFAKVIWTAFENRGTAISYRQFLSIASDWLSEMNALGVEQDFGPLIDFLEPKFIELESVGMA